MSTGNSKGPTKIPNLYEVLNLQPKENDDQAIRSALRLYAEQVKKMQPGEPAQAAAKLFAIAKQNLLDPVKKTAYDSLWDKVFGAIPSAQPKQSVATSALENGPEKKKERSNANVVNAITQSVEKVVSAASSIESKASQPIVQPVQSTEPTWDLNELEALLPSGDPSAPLDLSAFLESTELNSDGQRTMEDLDRDFQKLLSLLGVEVQQDALGTKVAESSGGTSATTSGPATSLFDFDSATPARPTNPTIATQASSVGLGVSAQSLPPVVATARPVSNGRPVPPSKVRKKRDRSLLMMVSGGLTVLLAVLGVLLVMLKRSNDQRGLAAGNAPAVPVQNAETNANNTPKPSGLPRAGSGLPQPGSGLPKPGENLANGGNDPAMQPSMQAEAPMQPAQAMPPATSPPVITAPAPEPTPPKPSENPTEPAKPDTSKPDPAKPDPAKPEMANAENKPAAVTPSETPMAEEVKVELTAQEKSAWKKQMRQARNLLGERQYEQAKELLGKIEATAKSGQQKAQLRRLSTVADFAEQFNTALMSGLEDAGDITVGNQVIALVEYTEEKLVVKMASGVKRYPWKDVPINLAYGYADLKLDQGPKSAAAKASFAAVHTKMNPAAIENARKLMQSAAAAEVVLADTHEVFDDDYSLE